MSSARHRLRLSSPGGRTGEAHSVSRQAEWRHTGLRACRLLLLQLTVGSAVDLSHCTHEGGKLFCASPRYVRPGPLDEFTSKTSPLSLEGGNKKKRVCRLRGFSFFDTTCQRSRFLLLLLLAVCSELLAVQKCETSKREQQMFLVDMRPAEEWKQQRGTGGPSSGSAAVESGWSPSFGSRRSSRHQVRP